MWSDQINESERCRNIIKKSNSDLPSMKPKHSNNYRPVFVFSQASRQPNVFVSPLVVSRFHSTFDELIFARPGLALSPRFYPTDDIRDIFDCL